MQRIHILTNQVNPAKDEKKDILWVPVSQAENSISRFINSVNSATENNFTHFEQLYTWSITNSEDFWISCWKFCGAIGERGSRALIDKGDIVDARFFPDSIFNFAENCLKSREVNATCIIYRSESGDDRLVSYKYLSEKVAALAISMRTDGVVKGDRVCGVVLNSPEAIICMLATLSIGAIWSSVSPDFGDSAILDRFSQIRPKVLFYSSHYFTKGKLYSVVDKMRTIADKLTLVLPEGASRLITVPIESLDSFCCFRSTSVLPLNFEPTNFNDPAFIMFSSGTTGKPKCIVHRHGSLLQLMKEHQLHCDIRPGDRVFYYTTTTWMMWNWLVASLASEAVVMLYDGNPFHPSSNALFEFAAKYQCSFFGVSAKFIDSLRTDSKFISPPQGIESIRTIASTGSPLIPESFDFVYSKIKSDVNLASICGGTDILSCFILGCPIKPVKRGFVQCRGLGMDVKIFDPATGEPVVGSKGELVCCSPFPSQPLGFWEDDIQKSKYRETYYSQWPNVWKHGDYCMLDPDGHVFVYGRSDATLNPGGVRVGTSEIYRAVETLPFIKESICCGVEKKIGEESVALFVVLKTGQLTADMRDQIKGSIRSATTRHHVPAIVEQVRDIPRTKSGKIVEVAVKNVLKGVSIQPLLASLENPESLEEFKRFK